METVLRLRAVGYEDLDLLGAVMAMPLYACLYLIQVMNDLDGLWALSGLLLSVVGDETGNRQLALR